MPQTVNTTNYHTTKPNTQVWYHDIFPGTWCLCSVVGFFPSGAAAAQEVDNSNNLALVCAFFQAEHPWYFKLSNAGV